MYRFFSVVFLQTGYVMVKNPYNVHYCLNACLQWHLTMHIKILTKCLVGKGLTPIFLECFKWLWKLGTYGIYSVVLEPDFGAFIHFLELIGPLRIFPVLNRIRAHIWRTISGV